jgi:hypothetical protein
VVGTVWNTADIWLRRDFILPEGNLGQVVLLMHHDEDAQVYINGVLATRVKGFVTGYQEFSIGKEARAALKPGKNVFAIHCHQTQGGQYIDVGLARFQEHQR